MDRITEKKLKNKRFKKTEEAIIIVLLSARELLSPERLIRLAHISRSTLYRHHKNVSAIAPNYEKYILRRCKNTMRRFMRIKNSRLSVLYRQILVFLSSNQLIMKFLFRYGDRSLTERIVIIIKPKILVTGKVKDGEMFTLYCKEVAGLIECWCQNGFNKTEIPATIDKITYLTNTAYLRLSPLSHFDSPQKSTSRFLAKD